MNLTNIKATAYSIVLGIVAFAGAKLLGADWTVACTGAIGILGGAILKHYFHITLPTTSADAAAPDTTKSPTPTTNS